MKMQNNYNPDVLSCLANLSNDEVFTSPKLANEILDLLPKEIWKDKNATFLDPVCKSGVFLREIAKRLLEGLKDEIPDTQRRINHIYNKQLFGIGITELTSLLSRRSLYCSKNANGKYSVSSSFENEQGNIFFQNIEHKWKNGRCEYCGASQAEYDREEELETHAYQFIHNNLPDKIKNMKFDVIIGNPPYQMDTGGTGSQATPIYQKFVQQAKKLNPRFLTMIIPARWYSGGMGLNSFREDMLTDNHLTKLVDFPDSSDCFPGVQIKGGVCYFLWDRNNPGLCEVSSSENGKIISKMVRPLLEKEQDVFIRYNQAISILNKIISREKSFFNSVVNSIASFGLPTQFDNFKNKSFKGSIEIYANKKIGFIDRKEILKNIEWIDEYKIFITEAYGAGETFPHQIINKPFVVGRNTCCTGTYLVIGPFSKKEEADNVLSYMKTRFFRFLIMLNKPTQHATSKVYRFVPIQDFSESWNDEKLYKKYKLTKEEIDFIESMIRPMQ